MEQFGYDRQRFDAESGADGSVGSEEPSQRPMWKWLAGGLLAVPGILLHLPVLVIILAWEKLLIRDTHLMPAARFAEGMILVPLWYFMAGLLAYHLTGSPVVTAVAVALLPASLWAWSRSQGLR
jgi:hypothetical protein